MSQPSPLFAEGYTLRLHGEVEPGATERVSDGGAAQAVPLGKFIRRGASLIFLDQDLDHGTMQRVLLGQWALVRLTHDVLVGYGEV